MIMQGDLGYRSKPFPYWVKPELAQTYVKKTNALRQAEHLGNCHVIECTLNLLATVEG